MSNEACTHEWNFEIFGYDPDATLMCYGACEQTFLLDESALLAIIQALHACDPAALQAILATQNSHPSIDMAERKEWRSEYRRDVNSH